MSDSVAAVEKGVSAEKIARASKSNLALAFVALPRQKRRDISTFYAFCRVVDDLADEPTRSVADRAHALEQWKLWVRAETRGEPPLAAQVRDLIVRYNLPPEHFIEIIFGCEMDLRGTSYETWDDLRLYCHRVASVVGLVSIEIFGYTDPATREYATDLGLALQLTNILRDVAEDYRANGRIYLPRADMDQFGYGVDGLALSRYDAPFRALMEFEAERARLYYRSAVEKLPAADRRAMVAAEIMRCVYQKVLRKMEKGGFRVFHQRYRLNRWEKLWCILSVRFARPARG